MYSGALLLRFGWKFEQKEIAPNTYVKYTERDANKENCRFVRVFEVYKIEYGLV